MNRIIDTNLRVSLTLSQNAYDIIMSDLNRFDYPKINYRVNFSGFLNQIFTNHHASSKKFSILRESLFELISKNNTLTKFQMAKVKIDINDYFLLHSYSDVNHNNKKKSFKFLLNKKNIQIINHKDIERYKSLSSYLKDVFESYASNPLLERERIFFTDQIQKISHAIKMKRILSIHLNDSTYKIFYPKEIYKNITHQTNEVLGFVEHPSNPNLKTFYTLRLSSILDLAYTGKFYSDKNLPDTNYYTDFKQDLTLQVELQLTPEGVRQFKNQYDLRPVHKSQNTDQLNNSIYTFEAPENQILLYFLKFGPNVKILKPKSLADKFRDIHKYAYEQYV